MATIASLSVRISANAQNLTSALQTTGTAVKKAGKRIEGVSSTLAAFSRGAAAQITSVMQAPLQSLEKILKAIPYIGEALALVPAAASAGFATLMGWFKEGAKDILSLNSAAIRLNSTVEDIEPILVLAGDGAESAAKGLFHMQRTIAEASAGSEEARQKLAHLGLTFNDLSGKTTGQQFGIIADRLNATKSAGEKAAYGMGIFSKSASEMTKIIRRGSAGLESFRKKLESEGGGTTSGQADLVKRAIIAMKTLDRVTANFKANVAVVFAPILEGVANWFGKVNISQDKTQESLLRLGKTVAIFGVLVKSAFTPWSFLRDGKAVTDFFNNVKQQIEDARKTVNKPEETGNFLESFIEHAEELTRKLRDQTEAYGQNSTAIELNRLARERNASLSNLQSKVEHAPDEHKQEEDAIRKKIEDLKKAYEATPALQYRKLERMREEMERLVRQLDVLSATQTKQTEKRRDDFEAAKQQAEAIYQAAAARAAEIETLDRITSAVLPVLNFYQEYQARLAELNAAFAEGKISAEGFAGGMRKIAEAMAKSEASKVSEIVKQTRTPLETMRDQIDLLNTMLDRGSISWEIYQRAVYGAAKSLMDLHKVEEKRMSAAAEFGSQEAYSIVNRNLLNAGSKQSGLDNLKDAIKKQMEIQQKQLQDQDEIARAARRGFLAMGRI